LFADVPNSGRGLPRLKYRTEEWDVDFREYLKDLDEKKPVIMCGDLNVAHQEIGECLYSSYHIHGIITREAS
jgi:exonuclease III